MAAQSVSQDSGPRSNPTAANIRAVADLEREALKQTTHGERIGQRITDAVGSMTFVVWHTAIMAVWIAVNIVGPPTWRFDPYPFGLLTFIVSLEGVLIATFVLIAQNRLSRQTDQRDHLNLQISMLAEQEMTLMLRLLRRISERLGVAPESREAMQAEKLAEETNVYELTRSIQDELPKIDDQAT